MDHSFDFTNLWKFDIPVVYNRNRTFLVVCRIRFSAVFFGFELWKTIFLLTGFAKGIVKSCLQIQLLIGESKTIDFLEIWIIFLILCRCNRWEFTSCFIAFHLICEHEIINLAAAAKGFCKHDRRRNRSASRASIITFRAAATVMYFGRFIIFSQQSFKSVRFLHRRISAMNWINNPQSLYFLLTSTRNTPLAGRDLYF